LTNSAFREAAARAAGTIVAERSRDAAADALEELAGAVRSNGALGGARAAISGRAS